MEQGVFIDRANWCEGCTDGRGWDTETCESMVPAQRLLLSELTTALGEGNITLAKEHGGTSFIDWQIVNAAMTSDAFCSSYCHGCNNSVPPSHGWSGKDAQDCADSIATIANMSARGQLTQSHAMGPVSGPFADDARAFAMASFLIGAGNLSYFSFANWATDCWTLAGTEWWPEYDRPLGEPTSPANTRLPGKRWKFWRNFSSATVYVDVATRVVDLVWMDTAKEDVGTPPAPSTSPPVLNGTWDVPCPSEKPGSCFTPDGVSSTINFSPPLPDANVSVGASISGCNAGAGWTHSNCPCCGDILTVEASNITVDGAVLRVTRASGGSWGQALQVAWSAGHAPPSPPPKPLPPASPGHLDVFMCECCCASPPSLPPLIPNRRCLQSTGSTKAHSAGGRPTAGRSCPRGRTTKRSRKISLSRWPISFRSVQTAMPPAS